MERKIKSKILRWKESGNRTALMIKGARQVGKTYIVNEFGNECYQHFLRIDCKDETFDDGFWGGEAKDIIRRITLRYTSFRAEGGTRSCSWTRSRTAPRPCPR